MPHLLDDDDDAWSYSFPPSTESLPLPQDTSLGLGANSKPLPVVTPDSKLRQDDSKPIPHVNGSAQTYGSQVETLRKGDVEDAQSQASSASSGNGLSAAELRKNRLLALAPISRTSSRSSASLQSPFLVKASPANPLTTKQDASSIISKDNLASGFEATLSTNNSARSSLLHNKSYSTSTNDTVTETDAQTGPNSPKIIAYRKSKGRSISESYPESPSTPKGHDYNLYTDETFRDTPYYYATMKRNTEFHQLFRTLDLTDRLLDDFSCALSREILLQGRIYVSEHYLCFNSNLLGWVTNLVIKFEDIVKLERKSTAGLFPNGISIETKDSKHNFASFLSRDVTYDFMTSIWSKSRGEHIETLGVTQEELVQQKREKQQEDILNQTPKIESYIMSIDGDDGDDENEDVSDGELRDGSKDSLRAVEEVSTKLLKFKPESKYKNLGPDIHTPTDASDAFTKEPNEVELCNEIIDAPLGIVFDILFGSSNTSFHRKFLETHDGSEISEYDEFLPMQEDPTKLERTYTYRRALGYSIGPKSTKCEVSEVIEHQNFTDYITLLTSTATPDVPLGQSFSVKTRYVLTWAEEGKTNLVLSFFISWTGRSWIKGVIEKQSLAGQTAVAKDLIKELKNEITASTYYVDGPTLIKQVEPIPKVSSESTITPPKKVQEKPVTVKHDKDWINSNRITFYIIGYFFISILGLLLISQLRILRVLKETNELTKSQVVLNNHLIQTLAKSSVNYDDNEDQFWEWVFKKYGKKMSRIEKIQFLSYQLNKLSLEEPKTGRKKIVHEPATKKAGDTFGDIKQKVEGLNYQGSLYVEEIRDMIVDLI
ncbi:uncharacterized protein CANTADRAFT_45062 [Suhomyces tanzawaensis NRRL Y-17324]|uniref:VASt domain-containing protein n=1 Tax=Suhomyces tanzawaensis NRRL Y-17324 TaxID=984487 RepID=A0A1E4SQK7_9ASCO|nr:uncharacterized protein CANTADRAFT_45062 [Suhomyces tanzawaensis NRRL Y-17324]ODV81794.1 hypothetical protein CANTADRAFT_45062 [Suhomyces tanzawaensis NRRL Y-17324]